MGWTEQGLRERRREGGGAMERLRERILPGAYQVCWVSHRGSWLQSVHALLRQQHVMEALFFQAYWETFRPRLPLCSHGTLHSCVLCISQGGQVHPGDWEADFNISARTCGRIRRTTSSHTGSPTSTANGCVPLSAFGFFNFTWSLSVKWSPRPLPELHDLLIRENIIMTGLLVA